MSDSPNNTDELVALAAGGDSASFSQLCLLYDGMLRKITQSFTGRGDGLADDLFQEALLAFYRAVVSYNVGNGKVTFGLYAGKCVRNAMISLYRKKKSEKRRKDHNKQSQPEDCKQLVLTGEMLAHMKSCLSGFEFKVLGLFLEDKSYMQIAEELKADVPSVRNALYRARIKLRRNRKTE